METKETQKFTRIGSSYLLIVLAVALLSPLVIDLVIAIAKGGGELEAYVTLYCVFAVIIWICLLMAISWGDFSKKLMKKTKASVNNLPYQFNSSFQSRGGILYIDVENGMIGFISAYNPFEVQIFSADRIDRAKTSASSTRGYKFSFYLDGKKITMPTLLTNKVVSAKSQMGMEAISKADTYVQLLNAAKAQAMQKKAGA